MHEEATITVNSKKLTNAQVMSVRVAVSNMITDLTENGLGEDPLGKSICANYILNLQEVEKLLL